MDTRLRRCQTVEVRGEEWVGPECPSALKGAVPHGRGRPTFPRVRDGMRRLICLAMVALLAWTGAFAPPHARAQGRPEILWMQGGHSNHVDSVAFSPNGRWVATASPEGTIKLWRFPEATLVRTFTSYGPTCAVFSPDSSLLASGGDDATVKLWRVADGALIRTLESHDGTVTSVAFSPDGKLLASASGDRTVRLWRVLNGGLVQILTAAWPLKCVAFSPDGSLVAAGGAGPSILLWRTSDGALLNSFTTNYPVASLAFSPDGTWLASGGPDIPIGSAPRVDLWRVADGTLACTMYGHSEEVTSVAFSPDGQLLASGSHDRTVKLWHVPDGSLVSTLTSSTRWCFVLSVAFSPDGQYLAVGEENGICQVWRMSDLSRVLTIGSQAGWISRVAFSPNGQWLVSANGWWGMGEYTDILQLWRVAGGELEKTLERGAWNPIEDIAFSPTGNQLAAAFLSDTISVWRIPEGVLDRPFHAVGTIYEAVAYSPDGQYLAAGGKRYDGWNWLATVDVFRTAEMDSLAARFAAHENSVASLAFSPDGQLLASGGWDALVKLWHVPDFTLVNTLSGHTDVVRNLAFSPNGARLASASADGTILLWRVSDGTLETSCTGHRAGVNSVAFSPNSQLLVSGSDDATIKLWRASTGALLRTFDQETGTGVLSVHFSPDGRRLAYGRCDATVVMARLDQRAPAALDWARSQVGQWRQPNRRPWYAQSLPFVAMAYGAPTPGYISVRQLYERLAAEGKVKQTGEPGDLAFWGQWDPITGRGRSGGHLAVYAGDGRVISTPLSKREPVSEYTLMEVTSRLSRVRANFLGFAPAPDEWPGRSDF